MRIRTDIPPDGYQLFRVTCLACLIGFVAMGLIDWLFWWMTDYDPEIGRDLGS